MDKPEPEPGPLLVTAYDVAERFIAVKETPGSMANPLILGMLQLDGDWPKDDSVPWCSAFVNYIAWLLRLPRSKSLRARSWLTVGSEPKVPRVGFDVVILKRGSEVQPGPDVIDAPGHVGFFGGFHPQGGWVNVLGGNQGDRVSVQMFPLTRVLGTRRLLR